MNNALKANRCEKDLNICRIKNDTEGDSMKKKEGRNPKEVFSNSKVQEAYSELKKVVEKKNIDVMKLFL